LRANVLLPEPEAPISTTRDKSGNENFSFIGRLFRAPENGHLGRRAESSILFTDGQKRNAVVVLRSHTIGPGLKFRAGPFEAVVLVTHRSSGHRFEFGVVLAVWRGHDDGRRASVLEKDAFESGEAGRVEMFNDLDYGCGVVAGEARVFVHQGALEELGAFALARGQRIETEALGCFF
jgi:cold shock CspA family protein